MAQDCAKLIREQSVEMGWTVLDLVIQPDHVHLCVRAWPTTSAYEVVRQGKGRTSPELRQKYTHLRRLPSLWTRSYLSSTAGTVSLQTIQRSIEGQQGV